MTLTREQWAAYPENWPALSRWVKFDRAGGRCECPGGCGAKHHVGVVRCNRRHGDPIPGNPNGSLVVLTAAHRDHAVVNHDPSNLAALCQACHLSFDARARARRDAT